MVKLVLGAIPETIGEVMSQAVASTVLRVITKESVEVARVNEFWPLAVISTVGAAKIVSGIELKTTIAVMSTEKVFLLRLLLANHFISV